MKRLVAAASTLAVLSATLILGGCATPGGGFMNTNVPADAGQAPTEYEQAIRAHLRSALKDPSSLMDFSVNAPVLASCSVGIYGSFYGWRVAASYNAKNSYGGYVGLKTRYYWFHGERIKGVGESSSFCSEAPGWR